MSNFSAFISKKKKKCFRLFVETAISKSELISINPLYCFMVFLSHVDCDNSYFKSVMTLYFQVPLCSLSITLPISFGNTVSVAHTMSSCNLQSTKTVSVAHTMSSCNLQSTNTVSVAHTMSSCNLQSTNTVSVAHTMSSCNLQSTVPIVFRFAAYFSLPQSIQPGCGAHAASHSVSPGSKAAKA
jgi:hypothetical protein